MRNTIPDPRRRWPTSLLGLLLAGLIPCVGPADNAMIFPVETVSELPETASSPPFDRVVLGEEPLEPANVQGAITFHVDGWDGKPAFEAPGSQAMIRLGDGNYITPATTLSWSWKKEGGKVCILQLTLRNPETGASRYFGYGAGALAEEPSHDPTVEIFVADAPPREWTRVERNLHADIRKVLGWEFAHVTEVYLSPWDGVPGLFADLRFGALSGTATTEGEADLATLSRIGKGHYTPLPLKDYNGNREAVFRTSFEELAPGRNSGANEWSAFGAIGGTDFNAMGRRMRVRYPVFDLVFRLYEDGEEVRPDTLDSFRLGLVNGRLPAIWGGWRHGGLLYKVSVMTHPGGPDGRFDLYKIEVQNPTDAPLDSRLVAGFDGPPDMRLEAGVVRGLGATPLVIADEPAAATISLRDWGLCDKRAKAYSTGPGPGETEAAVASTRIGLDGVPVVYRVRVEDGKRYSVYLVASPHLSGHLIERPEEAGDLVYEYRAEGAPAQTLDWVEYIGEKPRPLCVRLDGVHDVDRDGYIELASGVAPASRIRQTRLSAIYVFPEGTQVDDPASVYNGSMNAQCVRHVNVGATPEQSWNNQHYDMSDVGFARFKLDYGGSLQPGELKTYWLKVPPIHRRQPVSMGYIAHAFRDVLPRETPPPFGPERVRALQDLDPRVAEKQVVEFWDRFFADAAQFDVPDPILNDIFLSRLATRAILDVEIAPGIVYNSCSPFFYFDHAYRDQAYVIYGLDLAGLHDRAERLLRVYCMDVDDVVATGPLAFDGKPLQLGMLENGLWNTRPGQYDTLGQNIWCLSQHYKLSGNRQWLEETAYPYIRRGAMWIVNSRRKHMEEVGDPDDARYGLIEPGGMEVLEVGKGMHMYYMNGFAILGLRDAADVAGSLGKEDDRETFDTQALELKVSLHKSFEQTFKRTGLYQGNLWFGVEPSGVGMYGYWAHNCLVWPCRAIDPLDPMWVGTVRELEHMSNEWGGGMHSEGKGGFWPYIGVDRAVGYILSGERDKTLDYFCSYTDTAGGTLSWGEGYGNVISGGDQPHFWADGQWLNIYRQLFAFEDEGTLLLTPALFRRWHADGNRFRVSGLPTHFGDLDLAVQADAEGHVLDYRFTITPKGDQAKRPLERIVLYPRTAGGRAVSSVTVDGKKAHSFTRDSVVLATPPRNKEVRIRVEVAEW